MKVAEEEERLGNYHSFGRGLWPRDGVSQIPYTDDEQQEIDRLTNIESNTAEEGCFTMIKYRRYLPCHYFDYICGSSTGAYASLSFTHFAVCLTNDLKRRIAIMLERLRMTVRDCIHEYKNLGVKVFGNPRIFPTLCFGLTDSVKYKTTGLKAIFEDVTAR